jgi:hypothetical protein
MLQLQKLITFFLCRRLVDCAYYLEQRVSQQFHGLPIRKTFFRLLYEAEQYLHVTLIKQQRGRQTAT